MLCFVLSVVVLFVACLSPLWRGCFLHSSLYVLCSYLALREKKMLKLLKLRMSNEPNQHMVGHNNIYCNN